MAVGAVSLDHFIDNCIPLDYLSMDNARGALAYITNTDYKQEYAYPSEEWELFSSVKEEFQTELDAVEKVIASLCGDDTRLSGYISIRDNKYLMEQGVGLLSTYGEAYHKVGARGVDNSTYWYDGDAEDEQRALEAALATKRELVYDYVERLKYIEERCAVNSLLIRAIKMPYGLALSLNLYQCSQLPRIKGDILYVQQPE